MLSKSDISKLYLEKRAKNISNKQISKDLNISEAAISRFFNYDLKLSSERQIEIYNYIKSKPIDVNKLSAYHNFL